MADNVAITAGTGTSIATDDVGGVHYQRVKLATGADGSATDIAASNPLPVNRSGTSSVALANVSAATSSTAIFASDSTVRGRAVFNDSTANLMLKFGTTASATSFTVLILAGGYYEFPEPVYTGAVEGIWSAANGAARTTELT